LQHLPSDHKELLHHPHQPGFDIKNSDVDIFSNAIFSNFPAGTSSNSIFLFCGQTFYRSDFFPAYIGQKSLSPQKPKQDAQPKFRRDHSELPVLYHFLLFESQFISFIIIFYRNLRCHSSHCVDIPFVANLNHSFE
jgi:hypothetical protein